MSERVSLHPTFKAGDPSPAGYLDWHAWAEVQEAAGLRQVKCPRCDRWNYPQELSGLIEGDKAVCVRCITQEAG